MNHRRYLHRIGVVPDSIGERTLAQVERLQRAHVKSVPFETLAVTGDPHGDREGEGVSLAIPAFYDRIVDDERGGLCYELNGLFGWLLGELGYDVTYCSARVVDEDHPAPPADHLTLVVSLDRRYVVDVSVGPPWLRCPVALDGTVRSTERGVDWRVVDRDGLDAGYALQYRTGDGDGWTDKSVFRDVPRDLEFFEATCEHYVESPASPFAGDPVVSMATERGQVTLSAENLTMTTDGASAKTPVAPSGWHAVLEREFGIDHPPN